MAPLLTYEVVPNPSPLQNSSIGRLIILASNGDRQNKVVVKSLKIVLSVGDNQFDLTSSPGTIGVKVQGSSDWTPGRDGGSFTLTRNTPGIVDSLVIELSSIAVNSIAGGTKVKIYEIARLEDETNWSPEEKFEREIWKEAQRLWIRRFDVAPDSLRSGGSATFTWEASPNATLKMKFDKDGGGDKTIDVTDKRGTITVDGITRSAHVTFELKALFEGNEVASKAAVDVLRPLPKIVSFTGVRRDGALYVSWRCESASRCTLTGYSEGFGTTGRDVRVDGSLAFVYLTAYNASDESVTRDLFDQAANMSATFAKPLANAVAPQIGCSLDGAFVHFNKQGNAAPVYHIAKVATFPAAEIERAGVWMAFKADGSRYGVLQDSGPYQYGLFDAQHKEVARDNLQFFRPVRIDFAPDNTLMTIDAYNDRYSNPPGPYVFEADGSFSNSKSSAWVRFLSRERRYYSEQPNNTIRTYVNNPKAFQETTLGAISLGSKIAMVVADRRDMVYAALPDVNEVAVWDGKNPATIQCRIKVGRTPTGLAVTAGHVVVANSGDAFLSVIDVDTLTVVETMPIPEPACAVAHSPAGALFAYATSRNRVMRFTRTLRALQMTAPLNLHATQKRSDVFPGDFHIEHFASPNGAIAWIASGEGSDLAHYTLTANDLTVEVDAVDSRIIDAKSATLRATLTREDGPPLVTEQTIVIPSE